MKYCNIATITKWLENHPVLSSTACVFLSSSANIFARLSSASTLRSIFLPTHLWRGSGNVKLLFFSSSFPQPQYRFHTFSFPLHHPSSGSESKVSVTFCVFIYLFSFYSWLDFCFSQTPNKSKRGLECRKHARNKSMQGTQAYISPIVPSPLTL